MSQPSVASLNAVANWNVNKALELLRWEPHEKNHDKSKVMLSRAGQHFRNSDFARAWAKTLADEAKAKIEAARVGTFGEALKAAQGRKH